MKVDEYLELNEVRKVQEPEDYKAFIQYYKGMPTKKPEIPAIVWVLIIVESHLVNVESH